MGIAATLTACGPDRPVERPLAFADLKGWRQDDHAAAFAVFRRFCTAEMPGDAALAYVCKAADTSGLLEGDAARTFFETHFIPVEIVPKDASGERPGFLTGYYEPEFDGALERTGPFQHPLYARPDDLVAVDPEQLHPGLPKGAQFARRVGDANGTERLEPYPDRAAIEDGVLGDKAVPLVYLREPGEAFIVQVQGSTRIRLQDGRMIRVAYAGKNGQPYTAIGKVLVERGAVPLEEMNLERLLGWLRDHREEAHAVMRMNRSFVFFRFAGELAPEDGPIGAAGLPMVPGRSLAVDRTVWPYGTPVWLEGDLPAVNGEEPLARLLIALDTGSAIVGPARGDFYWGSGQQAGTLAGRTRHRVRFVALKPRAVKVSR